MSKGHVLVIEDHPDNQQLVTWILEDEDYAITCADTAEKGLELLKTQTYCAVIMDISLPGMDGKQATTFIRQQMGLTTLPIFALTAHALALELKAIEQSGVTGVLHKPIDEVALIAAIASASNL